MNTMRDNKIRKFNSFVKKYAHEFFQLIIMSCLFLFVLNKELVLFVKEFISAIPFGGNFIESIALKGYVVFNMLSSSPSLVALMLMFLQVVLVVYTIRILVIIFYKPFVLNEESLATEQTSVENYARNNKIIYLENLRLLC